MYLSLSSLCVELYCTNTVYSELSVHDGKLQRTDDEGGK